jgi:hypothetical protein
MSDMAFRQALAGESSAALVRAEASSDALRRELTAERIQREFLEAKVQRQRTAIENLREEADAIPLLKSKIHDLEEALCAIQEKLSEANAELTARYRELAGMTKALLSEEEDHEEQRREAQKLLQIVRAILLEIYGAPAVMSRGWLARRLTRRLERERLFDSASYAARFPDVAAGGQEPFRHYIFHGLEEIQAGTR